MVAIHAIRQEADVNAMSNDEGEHRRRKNSGFYGKATPDCGEIIVCPDANVEIGGKMVWSVFDGMVEIGKAPERESKVRHDANEGLKSAARSRWRCDSGLVCGGNQSRLRRQWQSARVLRRFGNMLGWL